MSRFDEEDVKRFMEDTERDLLPKMKGSALSIAIFSGSVDAKLCMEIGAAVLLDKPIILLVTGDSQIPASLQRAAVEIIHGHPEDPRTRTKVTAALSRHLPHKA